MNPLPEKISDPGSALWFWVACHIQFWRAVMRGAFGLQELEVRREGNVYQFPRKAL